MDELKAAAVPPEMADVFTKAQKMVAGYFSEQVNKPEAGQIHVAGDRYMMVRADSLTLMMADVLADIYGDRGADQIRYKVAKAIGISEARMFHKRFNVQSPLEKLGIGPVYFSFTGWAFVNLIEPSAPAPNDDYLLLYTHPHSFEAEAFRSAGRKANRCICYMNAGYSAGWCEESFGVPLDAREVRCEARGDGACLFVMTHTNRLLTAVGNVDRLLKEKAPLTLEGIFNG